MIFDVINIPASDFYPFHLIYPPDTKLITLGFDKERSYSRLRNGRKSACFSNSVFCPTHSKHPVEQLMCFIKSEQKNIKLPRVNFSLQALSIPKGKYSHFIPLEGFHYFQRKFTLRCLVSSPFLSLGLSSFSLLSLHP